MNQEAKNDRFKLAHHRLVARALKLNPQLLEEAREIVGSWKSLPLRAKYVEAWEALLARPIDLVRRDITRRTSEIDRLRRSSPFAITATQVIATEDAARLRRLTSRPTPIAR